MRRLAALGLLALAACTVAPEGEDEATEVAEGAILGGGETFERPEVGMFSNGVTYCTATLVRPNIAITAMHCTGMLKDADVSAGTHTFQIIKSATEKHTYEVERLHSIASDEDFQDGTQKWRAKDIALVKLAENVPAAVARPALIARAHPWLGRRVAVYGYGCTSRVTGENGRRPGGGTKRKKEYGWSLGLAFGWSDTQNVCPGDSGGPLLEVSKNTVFGTTSGYVDGNDRFGDVPDNYDAIAAVVARWSR